MLSRVMHILFVIGLILTACSASARASQPPPSPGDCSPAIDFTAPPYGSNLDLQGTSSCVNPADYKIAVFIFASGWYNKPTWGEPLTSIQSDGNWTCDITTGNGDPQATRIAAFLVPNGYTPPMMSGQSTLPEELYQNAMTSKFVDRPPYERTLQFSGYTWGVKASPDPVGPGPNRFSKLPADVWVDADGHLHLKIVYRNNMWYCTEVVLVDSFGYGTYTFSLLSRVDQLDPNVVLGLFTWDDTAPQNNYREIDIEFSRWGSPAALNTQYVIQPYTSPVNIHRFETTLESSQSTQFFDWRPEAIEFGSYQGLPANPGSPIESWTYTGTDNPPPGIENVRLNLWLMGGKPPIDGQEVEVVVEAFRFTPAHQVFMPAMEKSEE